MKKKAREKIPPLVWLIGAIILLIGVITAIAAFIRISVRVEGAASVALLPIGFALMWMLRRDLIHSGAMKLAAIFLFAVMGTFFDGAGNFIYNKPLELAFCPAETELTREVSTYETEDGDAYLHKFACHSASQNRTVKDISTYFSLGLRFFEYSLLGSLLVGIIHFSARFRNSNE